MPEFKKIPTELLSTDSFWLENIENNITAFPGGGLSSYIAHQNSAGVAAILSSDGRQGWVPGVRGEMLRLPLHSTDHIPNKLLMELFKIKKTFVVSFLEKTDNTHQANCFHYLVRDKNYSLDTLSGNTRSKIRRGLRNFSIRLMSWDELKNKGFSALKDTEARHGYSAPASDTLEKLSKMRAGSRHHLLWSAWDGDNLAAWNEWIHVDNWALIGSACSQTKYLRKYPNNALIYAATRHFLNVHQCTYVSYGISSIQARSNTLLSLHRFKLGMGYEAIPIHRRFIPKGLLGPILRHPIFSIILETGSAIFHQNSALAKIAGMARLLSGREKAPLAWANGSKH